MNNRNSKLKDGLVNFLTVAGDLIVLNFLWFICSIPLITLGPATNALYDACLRLAEDESAFVFKRFFKVFKDNFFQTLIVGVFSIFVIITLYADINYILAIQGALQKVYIVVAIMLLAMLLTIISYGNALIAKYQNTLKGHMINAFKLAFVNPVQTLMIWLILIAPLLAFLFIKPIILIYVGWIFLLYLLSLPVYLCSKIIIKVFGNIENRKG